MHVLCLLDVFANLTIFAHFFAIFFGYIHICGCHGPSGHQVVAKWSPSDLLVVDKWSFSCHQVVTKLSTSGHQVIIHSQKWSFYAPFTPKADNVHFLPFLSDPGVPGVRSMGPLLCNKLTLRPYAD